MIRTMYGFNEEKCFKGMAKLVGMMAKGERADLLSADNDIRYFMCWYELNQKEEAEIERKRLLAQNARAKLTDEEIEVLGVDK